jgi:sugar (pentulose or hexulose) kinase
METGSGKDTRYVLGIDVGTSGTKAILMDDSGKIAGQGYKGYRLYSDGKRVEQEAADWWDACVIAVRQAVSENKTSGVRAIGLSTQGATMLAIDSGGKPLGRAITWMDTRAQEEADKLKSLLGEEEVYRISGWRSSPFLDAAKILWMKKQDAYRDARLYLSTIEYLNLKLTGRAVIDPTNAAIRQLYNINSGGWDERILNVVGVSERELPEIQKTGEFVGTLTREAADMLGLDRGVKVYNGAHDQYCASIGCGAVNAGDMLVSTGTAWVLMAITENPIFSNTYISACTHPAEGFYGNMVSLVGTGASYQWVKDTYLPDEAFSSIDEKAARETEKCADFYFIPWLAGAFYPRWNPNARGGFIGMDFASDPYCMALAVMESSAFALKNAVQDFETHGFKPQAIKIMGGAAKSAVWLDILTALMDIPFYKMEITNSCALGAAFIAALGEGWYRDYVAAASVVVKEKKIRETQADRNYYREKFRCYNGVLETMEKIYFGRYTA